MGLIVVAIDANHHGDDRSPSRVTGTFVTAFAATIAGESSMIIPGYVGIVGVIWVIITMIAGDHCDDGPSSSHDRA